MSGSHPLQRGLATSSRAWRHLVYRPRIAPDTVRPERHRAMSTEHLSRTTAVRQPLGRLVRRVRPVELLRLLLALAREPTHSCGIHNSGT
jgi:hypothetical protein